MSQLTLQLSDIPPTKPTRPFRTVFATIVSIQFGSPSRLFITDMTSNPIMATNYAYNNYVGTTEHEIPSVKIMQVIAFQETFIPFMKQLEAKRNVVLQAREYARNVLNYALFVKIQLRMKWYNDTLEGVVDTIEILDHTADPELPVFKNVIQGLPESYVNSGLFMYEKTIPRKFVTQWLNQTGDTTNLLARDQYHSSPTPQRQVINQTTASSPATPLPQNHPHIFSSDLPSDVSHQSDYLSSNQQTSAVYTQVESTLPQRRRNVNAAYIRNLNSVDLVDGKVYDLSGIIVEVEPLLGQLCTKTRLDSAPVLNPINILIKANLKNSEENETIRISLISNAEVLAFLGLNEVEEVYIHSNTIWEKLQNILKSKKIQDFKIMRRLVKIGRCSILGWEAVNLKLDKLMNL